MKWKKIIIHILIVVVYVGLFYVLANAACGIGSKSDKNIKTTKDGIKYHTDGYIVNYVGDSNELIIPSKIKNVNIVSIFGGSLDNLNLNKLEIPSSIKNIGISVFENSNITNVYYNGTIEQWCEIEFCNIDSNPMSKCTNFYFLDSSNEYKLFTDLEIPEGIEKLNSFQFCNPNWKKIILPKSVKEFGSNVFTNDTPIDSIYYKGSILDWCNINRNSSSIITNKFYYYDNEYKLLDKAVIPGQVEVIKRSAFANIYSINEIIIEQGVKEIGFSAFNIVDIDNSTVLKYLVLPDSIEIIDTYAFYRKINNKIKFLPNNLKIIHDNSFCNDSFEIIEYNNLNYVGSKENPYLLCCGISNLSEDLLDLKIHDDTKIIYPNFNVAIKEYENNIKNLYIPKSIRYVDSFMFSRKTKIENLYYNNSVNDWNNVKIDSNTMSLFNDINNIYFMSNGAYEILNNVIIENVEYVGTSQYSGAKVTEVTLSNDVKVIENYAFSGCENLMNINLSQNLEYINDYAFQGCTSLESITIPDSVNKIDIFAFNECTSLKELTILSKNIEIEYTAFFNCDNLEKVYLKKELKHLENRFRNAEIIYLD